jgi:hypothetical protein
MPLVEVDSGEFEQAKASKTLLDKMGNNPKLRHKFLGLVKELNPDANIPEIDAAAPIMAEVAEARKTAAEIRAEIEKDREERKKEREQTQFSAFMENGRKYLQEHGYTQEGIASIEKLMAERGLPDYKTALLVHRDENPDPEPAIPTHFGRMWNLPEPSSDKDTTTKNWFDNPIAQSQREVQSWANELRAERASQRRR